jgi:hypothetical protein
MTATVTNILNITFIFVLLSLFGFGARPGEIITAIGHSCAVGLHAKGNIPDEVQLSTLCFVRCSFQAGSKCDFRSKRAPEHDRHGMGRDAPTLVGCDSMTLVPLRRWSLADTLSRVRLHR